MPNPTDIIPSAAWQSCGSGIWSTLLLAAGKGVPVVVFPLGWRWVPGLGALELAQRLGRREAEVRVQQQKQPAGRPAKGEMGGVRGCVMNELARWLRRWAAGSTASG